MLRGEIWLINLSPTIGAEMQKIRPVIIVNDDKIGFLPLKVIVPLTDWKERYTQVIWMTKIAPCKANGLTKDSAADAFQVRSVARERFIKRLGKIEDEELSQITEALAVVLGF